MLNVTEVRNTLTPREVCNAANSVSDTETPQTLAELLTQLEAQGIPNLPALKSKLPLMADLLMKRPDQVNIQDLEDIKPELRHLLATRRLAQNSIHTYISEIGFLLKKAKALGWKPTVRVPRAWEVLMPHFRGRKVGKLSRYLMEKISDPSLLTDEDINSFIENHVSRGGTIGGVRRQISDFRKALEVGGYAQFASRKKFSIPTDEFPERLRTEVREIIEWKTKPQARGRSHKLRIRPITAKRLEYAFCNLYGFTQTILKAQIASVADLVTEDILNEYLEWAINERGVRGQSICVSLNAIKAAIRNPKFEHIGGQWFRDLVDTIEPDDEASLTEKRIAKQIPYEFAETIPGKIRAERRAAARRGEKHLAFTVRDELIMFWLIVLPWRNQNLTGCRVEGPHPNLFKARLDPLAPVSKPDWVQTVLKADPETPLWQFKFSKDETKAKNDVHALLPRPLIPLLEEYLVQRKSLLGVTRAESLFLNSGGTQLSINAMNDVVSGLTLRHVGKRVTPHTFRHIVAYGWLKDHPADYLTVSKLLFHKDIQTTIRTYASRFNESDGACGMEKWYESRQKLAA